MNSRSASTRSLAERLGAKIFSAFSARFRRVFRSGDGGYAFIMALFLVLMVIIASSEAALRLSTEGRRMREDEAIWRGQQFVRAVRLFYRKTGHFPQNIEDLEKGQPELHFLRVEAYKDPLNSADGAWRFIYVNGSGAIIGSTRYASLQQMAIMDMNGGKIPGAPVQSGDSSSSDSSSSSNSSSASSSSGPNSTGSDASSQNSGGQGTGPGGSQNSSGSGSSPNGPNSSSPNPPPSDSSPGTAQSSSANNPFNPGATPPANTTANPLAAGLSVGVVNTAALAAMKPTGPVTGPVVGGFLVGVGSTIDQRSQKVYNTAKKYSDWEFIWNPIEEQARAAQNGGQGAPGALGQPAGTPLSGSSPLPSTLQQQQSQSGQTSPQP
jgi:hypothetical protein